MTSTNKATPPLHSILRFMLRIRPYLLAVVGLLMAFTIYALLYPENVGNPEQSQLIEMLVSQVIAGVGFACLPYFRKVREAQRSDA